MFAKTSSYVNSYDGQTKWMYFLIEDNDLLENYYTHLHKELDSELVYDKKYFKTKIKSHDDQVTDVYEKNNI